MCSLGGWDLWWGRPLKYAEHKKLNSKRTHSIVTEHILYYSRGVELVVGPAAQVRGAQETQPLSARVSLPWHVVPW